MKKIVWLALVCVYIPSYSAENDVEYNNFPDSPPQTSTSYEESSANNPEYRKTPPLERKSEVASNNQPKEKKIKLTVSNKTPHQIRIIVKDKLQSGKTDKILASGFIGPRKNKKSNRLEASIKESDFPIRMRVMHDGLRKVRTKLTGTDLNPLLEKVLLEVNENNIEVTYDDDGQLHLKTKK